MPILALMSCKIVLKMGKMGKKGAKNGQKGSKKGSKMVIFGICYGGSIIRMPHNSILKNKGRFFTSAIFGLFGIFKMWVIYRTVIFFIILKNSFLKTPNL